MSLPYLKTSYIARWQHGYWQVSELLHASLQDKEQGSTCQHQPVFAHLRQPTCKAQKLCRELDAWQVIDRQDLPPRYTGNGSPMDSSFVFAIRWVWWSVVTCRHERMGILMQFTPFVMLTRTSSATWRHNFCGIRWMGDYLVSGRFRDRWSMLLHGPAVCWCGLSLPEQHLCNNPLYQSWTNIPARSIC